MGLEDATEKYLNGSFLGMWKGFQDEWPVSAFVLPGTQLQQAITPHVMVEHVL